VVFAVRYYCVLCVLSSRRCFCNFIVEREFFSVYSGLHLGALHPLVLEHRIREHPYERFSLETKDGGRRHGSDIVPPFANNRPSTFCEIDGCQPQMEGGNL
jgi:hypothetical protein